MLWDQQPPSPFQDEYPDVFRFTASVFPSEDDDVITSPYNAMLSLSKLVEFADCVLPIENQALAEIVARGGGGGGGSGTVPAAGMVPEAGRGEEAVSSWSMWGRSGDTLGINLDPGG